MSKNNHIDHSQATGEAIEIWKIKEKVGRARVRAALDHVQQAQVELGLAMADLCSVIGYVPESDRLNKLYAKIKDEWYRLDTKIARGPTRAFPQINQLDHTPTADEQINAHAGGCGRRSWRESFFETENDGTWKKAR